MSGRLSTCLRASLAAAALAFASSAAADVTQPKPGLTLVKHTNQAVIVADLCAPGVSVRATTYAERKATPKQWAEGIGADAAVNADFFDFPGWSLVMGRARGAGQDWPADKQLKEVRNYWQFGAGVATLQPDASVPPAPPPAVTEIVGGHNILIAGGVSHGPNFDGDGVLTGAHRRTAVGMSADRRYLYLFVSNASLTGNGIVDSIVPLVAEAGAPAIDVATNMDGGGSSQMYVNGVGAIFATGRQVNNHLGVFAKGSGPSPNCPVPACASECTPGLTDRVALAAAPTGFGYWITTGNGSVFAFGNRTSHGGLLGVPINAPVVGMARTKSGSGYWLAASDGGVFSFGDAPFHGSAGGMPINAPVVGMAASPSGDGYWLVAADGGVFAFGDAPFAGSMGGMPLNAPVIGMAGTPSGQGYWLVAKDGGIFAFGDAGFHGSTGSMTLNAPIVGMAGTPSGQGYWLVAKDGGIFAFGDAGFHGSTGGMSLAAPVLAMAATPSGGGYWLMAADGGVFSFGDAPYLGNALSSLGCGGKDALSCGPWLGNGCNQWKVTATCSDGEACRNGVCEAVCADECAFGETACVGAEVKTCGNFDADPCLEWGPAAPCGDGKTCSGGACGNGVCTDDCVLDAVGCDADGSGVRVCDVVTGDGCFTWGATNPCADGHVCAMGLCVLDPSQPEEGSGGGGAGTGGGGTGGKGGGGSGEAEESGGCGCMMPGRGSADHGWLLAIGAIVLCRAVRRARGSGRG